MLAVALLGPPLAWVVGMPVAGLVGEASWRLSWVAVPLAMAVVALGVLARRPATPPAPLRADLRDVLRHQGVLGWSLGELLAYAAWVGTLVFVGALFVESYGSSVAATGLILGAGALVYIPGNLLFRRWVDTHPRPLLVGLALALGCDRRHARSGSTGRVDESRDLRCPRVPGRRPDACRERARARSRARATARRDGSADGRAPVRLVSRRGNRRPGAGCWAASACSAGPSPRCLPSPPCRTYARSPSSRPGRGATRPALP